MKRMKKLASVLLAVVMVLSMSLNVFATGTGTLTIKGTTAGKSYDLFEIFDITIPDGGTTAEYSINDKWVEFFNDGGGNAYLTEVSETSDDGNTVSVEIKNATNVGLAENFVTISKDDIVDFGQAALAYAKETGNLTADSKVTGQEVQPLIL